MLLKYIEFIWFGNLLLMQRCVWNAYSIIILADNCGCGVICHCGMSRGHCCIRGTPWSSVFWQLAIPLRAAAIDVTMWLLWSWRLRWTAFTVHMWYAVNKFVYMTAYVLEKSLFRLFSALTLFVFYILNFQIDKIDNSHSDSHTNIWNIMTCGCR